MYIYNVLTLGSVLRILGNQKMLGKPQNFIEYSLVPNLLSENKILFILAYNSLKNGN